MAPNADMSSPLPSPKNTNMLRKTKSLPLASTIPEAVKHHRARAAALELERSVSADINLDSMDPPATPSPRDSPMSKMSLRSSLPRRACHAMSEEFQQWDTEKKSLQAEKDTMEAELQEARRLAAEAQDKEAATLDRLLPDIVAGGEENMRLEGTVRRLEQALTKEAENSHTLEAEVVALRRLVTVLESTAERSSPSGADVTALQTALEGQLAARDAEQADLLAQLAKSLAAVEAQTRQDSSSSAPPPLAALEAQLATAVTALQESRQHTTAQHTTELAEATAKVRVLEHQAAQVATLEAELKVALELHAGERTAQATQVQELERQLGEAMAAQLEAKKRCVVMMKSAASAKHFEDEAQQHSLATEKARAQVASLEAQLAAAQSAVQASQEKLGEATAALKYELEASDAQAARGEHLQAEVTRLQAELQQAQAGGQPAAGVVRALGEAEAAREKATREQEQLQGALAQAQAELATARQEQAAQAAGDTCRDSALGEIRSMLESQLVESNRKASEEDRRAAVAREAEREARAAELEVAAAAREIMRAEQQVPPRLNLELLEKNGDLSAEIATLREENRRLTSRRGSLSTESQVRDLMAEDTQASQRIDLLLGEMDRSIGDLSHAMTPPASQRGLSQGPPSLARRSGAMLQDAMHGRGTSAAAEALAGELVRTGTRPYSERHDASWDREEVFLARKRATGSTTARGATTVWGTSTGAAAQHGQRARALVGEARGLLGNLQVPGEYECARVQAGWSTCR